MRPWCCWVVMVEEVEEEEEAGICLRRSRGGRLPERAWPSPTQSPRFSSSWCPPPSAAQNRARFLPLAFGGSRVQSGRPSTGLNMSTF